MRLDRAREAAAVAPVVGVTAVAAILRFWSLSFGFPQLTRPDEEAIVTVAARVARGDFNPGFFDYPTLFMYAVALVEKVWIGGPADPDDLRPYLIARALSATLGTLSVPLLFLVARRLFSTRIAVISSALLAVAFLHVRDSHFGVTDVPAAFAALAAFTAIVFFVFERPRWTNVLPAAVLCGLAASTKYNAGVIVMSLVAAIAQSGQRRNAGLYATAVIGSIAGFLAATPYAWIARDRFLADLTALSTRMAPNQSLSGSVGAVHHFTFSLWYGLGPLFLCATMAGIVVAAASWRARPAAILTISFPLLYYAAMGGGRLIYMRYMTPILPFAALLAALAIDAAASRTGGTIAAIALTALAGFDSASRSIRLDRFLALADSRVLAADYIRSHFASGVSMLQNGSPYGQVHVQPEGAFPTDVPLQKGPRLVVIQTSPLVDFSGVPPTLRADIAPSYRLAQRIDVVDPQSSVVATFDQSDAWYAPVAGFERYLRPGPTIEIFEKTPD